MSRTVKKPSRWWNKWWVGKSWAKPWQYNRGGYYGRRYKIHRKQIQREFRQATRLAIIHEREVPDLPPINWWLID